MKERRRLWLWYIEADRQFECDFVLAFTREQAQQLMRHTYGIGRGDGRFIGSTKLIETADPNVLAKLEPMWLGPDDELLEELGGVREPETPSTFPCWRFGNKRFGCRLTLEQRYPMPSGGVG